MSRPSKKTKKETKKETKKDWPEIIPDLGFRANGKITNIPKDRSIGGLHTYLSKYINMKASSPWYLHREDGRFKINDEKNFPDFDKVLQSLKIKVPSEGPLIPFEDHENCYDNTTDWPEIISNLNIGEDGKITGLPEEINENSLRTYLSRSIAMKYTSPWHLHWKDGRFKINDEKNFPGFDKVLIDLKRRFEPKGAPIRFTPKENRSGISLERRVSSKRAPIPSGETHDSDKRFGDIDEYFDEYFSDFDERFSNLKDLVDDSGGGEEAPIPSAEEVDPVGTTSGETRDSDKPFGDIDEYFDYLDRSFGDLKGLDGLVDAFGGGEEAPITSAEEVDPVGTTSGKRQELDDDSLNSGVDNPIPNSAAVKLGESQSLSSGAPAQKRPRLWR